MARRKTAAELKKDLDDTLSFTSDEEREDAVATLMSRQRPTRTTLSSPFDSSLSSSSAALLSLPRSPSPPAAQTLLSMRSSGRWEHPVVVQPNEEIFRQYLRAFQDKSDLLRNAVEWVKKHDPNRWAQLQKRFIELLNEEFDIDTLIQTRGDLERIYIIERIRSYERRVITFMQQTGRVRVEV